MTTMRENAILKYTLARLGLFAVTAVVLVVIPMPVHLLIKLAAAVLVSAVLSFVLFRGLREQVAEQLAGTMQRRAEAKRRLRAALAGEDEPREQAGDEPREQVGDEPREPKADELSEPNQAN